MLVRTWQATAVRELELAALNLRAMARCPTAFPMLPPLANDPVRFALVKTPLSKDRAPSLYVPELRIEHYRLHHGEVIT